MLNPRSPHGPIDATVPEADQQKRDRAQPKRDEGGGLEARECQVDRISVRGEPVVLEKFA